MTELILLVDDDALLNEAVAYTLERNGYRAEAVTTAAEALRWAQTQRADLALLDIGLPDQDGLQLCRSLRAAWPGLPVIFLTAHDREMDVLLGFERGAADYSTKPFNLSEPGARLTGVAVFEVPEQHAGFDLKFKTSTTEATWKLGA